MDSESTKTTQLEDVGGGHATTDATKIVARMWQKRGYMGKPWLETKTALSVSYVNSCRVEDEFSMDVGAMDS